MPTVITVIVWLLLLIPFPSWAQKNDHDLQFEKETSLVKTLKSLMTCKNMGIYEDGDLYCTIKFRGLTIEFAGVNAKGGGTVYVTSLGPNQTIGLRGRRCILVIFGDKDLRGVIEANILFRDDGTITHTYKNKKAWAECQ